MEFNDAMKKFHDYFREDLLGFIKNKKIHNYRAVIAGGYGLKKLLETKLGLRDRIRTHDCDITITSFRTKKDLYSTYSAMVDKVTRFIHEQEKPNDFQVVLIDQANQYVEALNYRRFAVIMIKYKGYDFVDIAFTDMKLTMDTIDKQNSLKCGLPLKKLEAYLRELLMLIYMENVTGVYPYLYYKRNPIEGDEYGKGRKDISRAKLVCELTKSKKYIEYCGILNRVNIDDMARMSREDRNKFFKALSSLMTFRKRKVNDLTKSET